MIPPPSNAAAAIFLAFYFGSKNSNVLHFLSSLSLNQVVKASRSHQIFHEEVHI
jgi:hypothetical protein